MIGSIFRLLAFALLLISAPAAFAQNAPPPSPASAPASAPAGTPDNLKSPAQLDALVAPIALYPDNLLSLVLMASTYPLEVVQADRWVNENKNLQGDQLKAAAEKQEWDDSVKSLVATPDVLSLMSRKLDWTQELGDAMLAQESDVMNAVQRLRARAQANNKLMTTKEQKVSVRQEMASGSGLALAAAARRAKSLPSSPQCRTRCMCPITTRPSCTARGRMTNTRLIISAIRTTSVPASSGRAWHSARHGGSGDGPWAAAGFGAAVSTGTATTSAITTALGRITRRIARASATTTPALRSDLAIQISATEISAEPRAS